MVRYFLSWGWRSAVGGSLGCSQTQFGVWQHGDELKGDQMAQLNLYLKFNGNCRQALEFYKSILGGQLVLQTVGDSPSAGQFPPVMKDRILHGSLAKDDLTIFGTDIAGPELRQGNNVFLCLICKSKDEIEALFSKLSQGGKITNPLKQEFFGTYGDLAGKFGINWMFQSA
jgi:PhnB protein